MQNFIESIIFAFKNLSNKTTIKYSMSSGIVIGILWGIIGMFLWPHLVDFSSFLIAILPFSIIRSNGALMLSTFIWIQIILITFAFIFIFSNELFLEKLKKRYIKYSITISIFLSILWGVVWFNNGDLIYKQFLKLLNYLPFEMVEKGLAYLISFYIIYTFIIITNIFISSVFSYNFLEEIQDKYFPFDEAHTNLEYKTIKKTTLDTIIFLSLSIILFPLLFIPLLNLIILLFLWNWLMKDTIIFDVMTFIYGKIDKDIISQNKYQFVGITFIGSLFNFIPIFNLFAPYFTQLAIYYYLKNKEG